MPEAYGDLQAPTDGVIVHGVFLDAGRWDMEKMKLVDAKPGILTNTNYELIKYESRIVNGTVGSVSLIYIDVN